jgi:predicted helicase
MDKPTPTPESLSRNYSKSPIFFTPEPLVNAVIDGCNYLISHYFPNHRSIFDLNISFLDPAAGMLVFPIQLKKSAQKVLDKNEFDIWQNEVFAKKMIACEVNEDIYQKAMLIWQKEIDNEIKYFFNINTLDEINLTNTPIHNALIQVHKGIPCILKDLTIIFGNPPYAISSITKSSWISKLIQDYKPGLKSESSKKISGVKGIQDDYIKFIRFGQWKLADQNHLGILAFVVNNYFLDGTVFRGMRESLLNAFDAIWIINLHGDPKKKSPSASKDENVFDIQTGICLFFAVKCTEKRKNLCDVFYCEIKGPKSVKFQFLTQPFERLPFQTVIIRPNFEFIPISDSSRALEHVYHDFVYLPNIFLKHVVGVRSLHDTLITHPDRRKLEEIITHFFDGTYQRSEFLDSKNQIWYDQEGINYHDARDWLIQDTRNTTNLSNVLSRIIKWSWRGMDRWWVAYDPQMMTKGCSSFSLMQYLLTPGTNLAIGVSRVSRKAKGDTSVWITDTIAESHFIEGGSGIGDYIFPLRINHTARKDDWNKPKPASDSNISPEFKKSLPYWNDIIDDEIFYYSYAILWTPKYRQEYHEFLKQDFPRIPFPNALKNFQDIAVIGKEISELHLSKPQSHVLNNRSFSPISSNKKLHILNPDYEPNEKRIYFDIRNKVDSFWIGDISQQMWDFDIGGLPQLSLWLNNRKFTKNPKKYAFQRAITKEELDEFLNICNIIEQTLFIVPKLDLLYQKAFTL